MHPLRIILGLLCFGLLWAQAQPAESEVVGVELTAFVVTETVLADGTRTETFTEAEAVFPGQVIEYRLVATNRSGAVVSAGRLTLVGPVPESTRYLADSATADGPDWRLEASLDGEVFAEPPLRRIERNAAGQEVEVDADPGEYRALRWVVLMALAPGETITFRYRVAVP